MRRVHLWQPGTGAQSVEVIRQAACALALYAVDDDYKKGRVSGDPIHEEVTEGRRKAWEDARKKGAEWARTGTYSSCGDLAHWLLYKLGCREDWVNRREHLGWKVQANIWKLVTCPAYVRKGEPIPGDILHMVTPGIPNSDHVCAIVARTFNDLWITCDYGQPYGLKKDCPIDRQGDVTFVRGRLLKGYVDLSQVALKDSALVPDDFEGGVDDDNPYR